MKMPFVYLRGFFLIILLTFGLSINADTRITKFIVKYAGSTVKYGLLAWPLLYVAIKEGIYYFNLIVRVEKAVEEVQGVKKTLSEENEKTRDTLQRMIAEMNDKILPARDKVYLIDGKMCSSMQSLKKMSKKLQSCATCEDINEIKNQLKLVFGAIEESKRRLFKQFQCMTALVIVTSGKSDTRQNPWSTAERIGERRHSFII